MPVYGAGAGGAGAGEGALVFELAWSHVFPAVDGAVKLAAKLLKACTAGCPNEPLTATLATRVSRLISCACGFGWASNALSLANPFVQRGSAAAAPPPAVVLAS